ncbi:uncharacterized protein CC84DRAFT_642197 [Paraphaeosphaeria sporulosa]|uniref:Uncharacterized protein n=1 Tax=Paraphaeosphaeria sporulosa TaxID=1460663 RepID=A0A177CK59_9PLEO|nr:uncharacterized protein CC84DRAFT_642197 [Paraphaeosphaeria sporulosa]OAG07177.1 hypothetical protein CC84DRAFT_642197 [Paraphaeosphaeria sporulosa]
MDKTSTQPAEMPSRSKENMAQMASVGVRDYGEGTSPTQDNTQARTFLEGASQMHLRSTQSLPCGAAVLLEPSIRASGLHSLVTMHGRPTANTTPFTNFSIPSLGPPSEECTDGTRATLAVVALSDGPSQSVEPADEPFLTASHTIISLPTTASPLPSTLFLPYAYAPPAVGKLAPPGRGAWFRTTWQRIVDKLSQSSNRQLSRATHMPAGSYPPPRFERTIDLNLTQLNGEIYKCSARALIDIHSPCNLISASMIEGFPPLVYESTERKCYARTPAGLAYSNGRVKARWHCEDRANFDPTFEEAEFWVMEHDIGCDIVLGEPTIREHRLLQPESWIPLAVPMGCHTRQIQVERSSISSRDASAEQVRQNEYRLMGQSSSYEVRCQWLLRCLADIQPQQQRHAYAHGQAHNYVRMAYDNLYAARYEEAKREFDKLSYRGR